MRLYRFVTANLLDSRRLVDAHYLRGTTPIFPRSSPRLVHTTHAATSHTTHRSCTHINSGAARIAWHTFRARDNKEDRSRTADRNGLTTMTCVVFVKRCRRRRRGRAQDAGRETRARGFVERSFVCALPASAGAPLTTGVLARTGLEYVR